MSSAESQAEFSQYQAQCERWVIGICLASPDMVRIVTSYVSERDFLCEEMRCLCRAISLLEAGNELITFQSVAAIVMRQGMMKEFGGAAGYARLAHESPPAAQAEFYARELARLAYCRRLYFAAMQLQQKVSDKNSDPSTAFAEFEAVTKTYSSISKRTDRSFQEVFDGIIEKAKSKDDSAHIGKKISTGYPSLDSMIAGFFPKNVILLGGRFGIGKSGMAAEMVACAAAYGMSSLVFSLEMTKEEFSQRVLSSQANVSMNTWGRRRISEHELQAIESYRVQSADYLWRIEDSARQSMKDIRAMIRITKARQGLDLVVIDNLQLLKPMDFRKPRDQQLTDITGELKRIAKESDCAVLLLCQLNADAEGERPTNKSWAGGKAIVGDADVCLLLHRPKDDKNEYELIVSKNRSRGNKGIIEMKFDGEHQRFIDVKAESLSAERPEDKGGY